MVGCRIFLDDYFSFSPSCLTLFSLGVGFGKWVMVSCMAQQTGCVALAILVGFMIAQGLFVKMIPGGVLLCFLMGLWSIFYLSVRIEYEDPNSLSNRLPPPLPPVMSRSLWQLANVRTKYMEDKWAEGTPRRGIPIGPEGG